ncbi:MAG: AI-2E family transporter [Deltaproteobacteria bacterium]|nr:AI-2E family transporter [Deltaproteobacteria bacterium]
MEPVQLSGVARRPPADDVAAAEAPPPAPSPSSVALIGLFVLAVLYTLYLARVLVLPIVLAIITSFILAPIVRGLRRARIPDGVGAALVLAALAAAVAWGVYTLSGPATTWVQAAPQALRRIEAKVRIVKDAVQDLGQATSRVEQLTTVGEAPTVVAVQGPGLGELLLFGTWNVVAAAGLVLILAYFLLASGDLFLRKLVGVLPRLRDRKVAVAMSREIQESVSAYLFTVSLINAGFGVAVGASMWAIGMPNPLLWGALAAVLNFVPFIGPLAGIGIVFAAAMLTFDSLGAALAAPGAYLAWHILEGSFLTPLILSRRFTLNPVVVILGLIFWGWIWGIAGALLAMPLLVTLKILCDHIPSLAVLGEFLGD